MKMSLHNNIFEIALPYYQMPQSSSSPGLITAGFHPEIYQSWHTGISWRNGRTASCKTNYP